MVAGGARAFFGTILYRNRYGDFAGVARKRSPYQRVSQQRCWTTPERKSTALSAFLAGIRGEKTARRRRRAHFFACACVQQPRTGDGSTIPNSPCSNGIARAQPYQTTDRGLRWPSRRAVPPRAAATLRFGGHVADPFEEPEIFTVAEAFDRYARIDLLATLNGMPAARRSRPARAITGSEPSHDDSWSDLFSKILVGNDRTASRPWPRRRSSWTIRRARRRSPICRKITRFAERFELYACGVELANGFGELTDPAQQRQRFEMEMAERREFYGEAYPIDEDFLQALRSCPRPAASRLASTGW